MAAPAPIPLSLYVHLPWCLRKCPYCDFNSHEHDARQRGRAFQDDEAAYLDALRLDLEASLPSVWGRQVQSVFIGGGTPSLFSPQGIDRLLSDIRARLRLAPRCEITMEANPGTFERERFEGFRAAGVTRLSLGVQSFDDTLLKAIGRVHDAAQARAAAESAAQLFETFNLDLMYALPGQSIAQLEADIETALEFAPPHLSVYHLTMEPNTLFARHPPTLPDEDTAHAMQDLIDERLACAGFDHYETSAHARHGHQCVHNRNYWEFGDYLGIGAGAHGKLSMHDRIVRQVRVRHPGQYMEAAMRGEAVSVDQVVARKDLPFEFMLNALRLKDGVPAFLFAERTRLNLADIAGPIAKAVDKGLFTADPTRLAATPLGWRFLNDLQQIFL